MTSPWVSLLRASRAPNPAVSHPPQQEDRQSDLQQVHQHLVLSSYRDQGLRMHLPDHLFRALMLLRSGGLLGLYTTARTSLVGTMPGVWWPAVAPSIYQPGYIWHGCLSDISWDANNICCCFELLVSVHLSVFLSVVCPLSDLHPL